MRYHKGADGDVFFESGVVQVQEEFAEIMGEVDGLHLKSTVFSADTRQRPST
jgi:hypothetical protein